MIYFIVFGVAGAIFYRQLLTVATYKVKEDETIDEEAQQKMKKFLFWLDWPLIRIVSFCYMLMGHFSRALPIWLENCFNVHKAPYMVLSEVAKQAEDFQVDPEDCTEEPCLLVRLAKRSLLLILTIIAILTITGVIQ